MNNLEKMPLQVFDTIAKMKQVLQENTTIAVSVSGGSDSDVLIDLFEQNKTKQNRIYIL